MKLPHPLIEGRLVRRYKRFLADVELSDGSLVTAHTANTGSMLQCAVPGRAVLLSKSNSPKRKFAWSWELVLISNRWVDINTHRANRVVEEALRSNSIAEFQNYKVSAEFPFARSRIDFMLEGQDQKVLLEVKNVTFCCQQGIACFPDAVTKRGQKHLLDLMAAAREGWRAVIFFLVQRSEAEAFTPADAIDANYGRLLRNAVESGVEALAYRTVVTPDESRIGEPIAVLL
ncbi:MAG: DNA/RNA nuclease SfsA [Desulfuromonadales bacterium]